MCIAHSYGHAWKNIHSINVISIVLHCEDNESGPIFGRFGGN